MKIVGLMPLKNEADLLPEVLHHLRGELDDLFVIDGDSVDDTYEIAKQEASYIIRTSEIESVGGYRPHYHHLLETIKKSYSEEVWVVITMGDRFYLNLGPRDIVEECLDKDYGSMHGRKVDFLRPVYAPWTPEMDTFPNYGTSLRHLNRWASNYAEEQVFAFKLTDDLSYAQAKYPWPQGLSGRRRQKRYTRMTPFQEHQGRRSPKATSWRFNNGSIKVHSKNDTWDLSTTESTRNTCTIWHKMDVFPWTGTETLDLMLERANVRAYSLEESKAYFQGVKDTYIALGRKLPPRNDI